MTRRWTGPACLLVVLLVTTTTADARKASAGAGHLVYLNFSEGNQAIKMASADDATLDQSQLCQAGRVGRWLGGQECGDPASCKREIQRAIESYWTPFDVMFTTERPAHGPFTMAVIGPPSGSCGFGAAGVAPVDCGDRNSTSVAFAFECAGTVIACARLVSHELGHAFGLAHSDEPCDLMSNAAEGCSEAGFHDADARVSGPACGALSQNSYRLLMNTLGPGPPAAAPAGGCSVLPSGAPSALLLLSCCTGLIHAVRTRKRRPSAHMAG